MMPDTDEQLIDEVKKFGGGPVWNDRTIELAVSELRALIDHYIALDRAQGQEHVATVEGEKNRALMWAQGVLPHSIPSGTKLYAHGQPGTNDPVVSEGLKMRLLYFKEAGKFYTEGILECPDTLSMNDVFDRVWHLMEIGQLPGLVNGARFDVVITGEGHPQGFPALLKVKKC